MRTTPDENARLGETIAQKANVARGPVKIILPLRGVSAIDAAGQPFYDPAATAALFQAIRRHASVEIKEIDAHINDPQFAASVVAEFMSMLQTSARSTDALA
jgi:uncharacterized protein (UPF0261 family)